MGLFDSLFATKEKRSPEERLVDSLRELEPAIGNAFSAYLLNKARISVLARETSEQYQLVKSRSRTDQARAMEPCFREMLALVERQAALTSRMQQASKQRRFKMSKPLSKAVESLQRTEETCKRIAQAVNDPVINRLQGLHDALTQHKQMEESILWPGLY